MDKKSGGFTLIDLIVVIAIFGILAALAVPRFVRFRSKAEESVCAANRKIVETMYMAYLIEKGTDHEDSIFDQSVIENFDEACPTGGVIRYEDGKVKCSVHASGSEDEQEEGPGEEVPWL